MAEFKVEISKVFNLHYLEAVGTNYLISFRYNLKNSFNKISYCNRKLDSVTSSPKSMFLIKDVL